MRSKRSIPFRMRPTRAEKLNPPRSRVALCHPFLKHSSTQLQPPSHEKVRPEALASSGAARLLFLMNYPDPSEHHPCERNPTEDYRHREGSTCNGHRGVLSSSVHHEDDRSDHHHEWTSAQDSGDGR